MDQIAALHWIRDNIAAFGGEPNNVTLMGRKKAAIFVNLLMLSPLAKGECCIIYGPEVVCESEIEREREWALIVRGRLSVYNLPMHFGTISRLMARKGSAWKRAGSGPPRKS